MQFVDDLPCPFPVGRSRAMPAIGWKHLVLFVNQDREGALAICASIDTLALDRDVWTKHQPFPRRDGDAQLNILSRLAASTDVAREGDCGIPHLLSPSPTRAHLTQGPRSVAGIPKERDASLLRSFFCLCGVAALHSPQKDKP